MAAEDILGISAHIDASDMLQTFEELSKKLDKLGYDTTNLQSKLNKAWNEISTSTDTNSEKTQRAFKVIADAMATYQKQMESTPQAIKNVNDEINKAVSSIENLKSRISKTDANTAEFGELNRLLEGQERILSRLTSTYTGLQSTFSETQQTVMSLNAAFDVANAGRSISNVTTDVNAGAHVAAAAAVGTEATAHGQNATKIGEETQKVQENTAAVQQAAEASKQSVTNSNEIAEAIKRVTERLQEGKASDEEYQRQLEEAKNKVAALSEEYRNLGERVEKYRSIPDEVVDGKLVDNPYHGVANNLANQQAEIGKQRDAILDSLAQMQAAYEKLHETQQQQAQSTTQSHAQETEQTNKETDAIKAKEEEIKRLQAEYAKLSEQRPNFWGLGTDVKEQKFPFETLIEWNKQTGEARLKIYEAEAELEKMKIAAADVKNETADMWAGMTKEDIAGVIKENIEELKVLKSEYQDITKVYGSNSDEAKKNKQQQEEITKEILEGKNRLKEMGVSYEDVTKQAKNAAKATKDIGDEASKASEKAKGIFDKLKSFITKGLNPESLLSMVFSPKGATMAGITAVAAGLKNITQINEQLAESMIPLKAYVDGGTLEELRAQFVALEYESSHSAEEMAAGATRWVKYFEGIRGNADVIADVTKSSNDFATVLGTTSEKAADYQLKIAGAYHQTALEAKGNSTIIINATKGGTAKYEEMAQALAHAANRAQNAGVSFKELAAATTYGTSTFGSASEAANAYVMMMTRLSTQSKNEYNPTVVGATKALQNLAKSQNMNATLTSLLGKRQASLAKVFVQGAANIKQMQGGLDDEASAARTLAGAENKLEEQEKRLANAKRALAHEVNVNLTPTYANFLESCSSIIKGIGNFSTTIKNSLKSALQWINSVDDAIKDSTIYKLFGGTTSAEMKQPTKGGKGLNIDKKLNTLDENSWWDNHFNGLTGNKTLQEYNDQRRKRIQDNLKKLYQDNLKKYGAQSPGKAMMATLNAYNHNSEFDNNRGLFTGKEIRNYVAKMMNTTRAENKAKVTGNALAIGDFNSIPDTKGENKLKQLQEQQRQFREQEAEQQAKDLANAEKVKWNLYLAEKEAGIARLENASEKEAEQHKLDYEKQKHAIEEEQKSLLQQNIAAAKQAYDKTPDNKKKEGFYASGLDKQVTLTSDQKALIQAKYDVLSAQESEYNRKQFEDKLQYLRDYLKEYGTIQEQRLAIAQEYDAKIAQATDENQKKSLQKQKESELSKTDAKKMAMGIDWGVSFEGIGNVLKDIAKETLQKVEDYMKTADFKKLDASDKKAYSDLRNNLRAETGGGNGILNLGKWDEVAQDVAAYQNSVKWLQKATKAHDDAIKQREDAENELKNAVSDKASELAQIKLNRANKRVEETGEEQKTAEGNVQDAHNKLTKSTEEAANGLQNFQTMLGNITSGSLSGFAKGIGQLISSLSKGGSSVGEALQGLGSKVGGLIGAILSIIDALGDDPTGFIDGLFEKITKVIDAILAQLPQIVFTAIKGIGEILFSVVKGLTNLGTFGLTSSLFDSSNGKEVQEAISDLTSTNKSLQQSIDDLNDTMKNSSGAKSVEAYKEAYKLQEQQNENYKKIAQEQAGYHGSHHSWNKYWNGFSDEQTKWIKEHVKSDFNGDLWSLTPEEMKQIRGGNIDIWNSIKNTGKGGYGDRVAEKLDDYIDQADKLQELTDQINESLTQVSFSSMKDDFVSNLMDMSKTAEDFANDFAEMMQKSVLRYGLENLLNTDLKKLYEKWGAKMQQGNLTKDDIDNLKSEYDDLVKKGLEQRDYWAQITGYTGDNSQSQQTATGKAIEAITADQASTLIGIGYAMQSAVEIGNETRKQISVDVASLRAFSEQTANNISEMRDIQYQGLEQLQAINKNTFNLFAMKDDLASLNKIAKDYWR